MAALLLVNPRSGSGEPDADTLVEEARERGIRTHVLGEDDDAESVAREAEADALGMAGGDGSLARVAAVAIERDLPFVCVPFGTRNHFARDLGLDRDDPIAALEAFRGGETRIDVARAGDRLFVNNVSLGLYARLVHRRERHRRRRQMLARLRALLTLVRHPGGLRVTVDGEPVSARVVLVANNHYELDLLSVGERERLDDGLLHLYASSGLLRSSWEERTGERFVVDAAPGRVPAAVDGEPVVLETPIEFRIEPRALRVLLPPGVEHGGDDLERELVARRELVAAEPAELGDVVGGPRLSRDDPRPPDEI
jgi:diacylglycerol kinase family enzyme